jgi:hypothetical protein
LIIIDENQEVKEVIKLWFGLLQTYI